MLHSMHCDSGTLCSSHQSSTLATSLPMSAENFGSVQSVLCPHAASAIKAVTTAKVGMALPSRCQRVTIRRIRVGCGIAGGAAEDGATDCGVNSSRFVTVD